MKSERMGIDTISETSKGLSKEHREVIKAYL